MTKFHARPALVAVVLVASSALADTAPASTTSTTRTGAGIGLVIAPTFNAAAPVFLGGLGVLELDFAGAGPVGFNLSAQFGGGVIPVTSPRVEGRDASAYGLGALLLTPELRLRFTSIFSSGIGVTLGPIFGGNGTAFWLGPSVTLLAARFAGHHQVTVGLAPLFQLTGTPGFATLLPTLRYTYFF